MEKIVLNQTKAKEAYDYYKNMYPLNFNDKEFCIKVWQQRNRFLKADFYILIAQLLSAKNIDEFIQTSQSDFDNLGPLISSCINKKIISVLNSGNIKSSYISHKDLSIIHYDFDLIEPKPEYNQFPCTSESVKKRIDLLHQRFPFSPESPKIAFIGDDDMVSLGLSLYNTFKIHVYEADCDIVDTIAKKKRHNISIYCRNLINENVEKHNCDTFMTDPPYTLHGAVLFILRGLETMQFDNFEEKEFYVILNKTMMGNQMLFLQQILLKSNIWIREIRANFSQYMLPESYNENKRVKKFSQKLGIGAVKNSSSSDLFILRTDNPNLKVLKEFLDKKLIYNHYA